MAETGRNQRENGCWRGRGDPAPYVPGVPEEIPRAGSIRELFDAMVCCTRCDLARERTQVVTASGSPDARILLIGEAPGAQEDREGVPFVGRAGKLLDRLLEANGLARDDVFITNMVACRPPKNRTPRVREIRAHAPWLEAQIRLVRPDVIVTLGRVALTYFVPGAKVTEFRGRALAVEHQDREVFLLPVLHPAAALRRRELLPALEKNFAKLPGLLARATRGG